MNKSRFSYTLTTNIPTIGMVVETKTKAVLEAAELFNEEGVEFVNIKKDPI